MIGAIKTKLLFALKSSGFGVHKMSVVMNKNGSFTIGALVTNDKAGVAEEITCVIKEDFRNKQLEETD